MVLKEPRALGKLNIYSTNQSFAEENTAICQIFFKGKVGPK